MNVLHERPLCFRFGPDLLKMTMRFLKLFEGVGLCLKL
jgi:hypothetical protein